MMYSNNCVLAVLVNGTPCNELANGSVPIPFNSEYVIRVRNKDKKRRVVAKVFVDGENVAKDGIIVNPNSYVDLEGPVDLHKRFKFVSLDSPDAVDFGKNGPNHDKSKGLIEAHFHFEKEVKTAEKHHHHHHHYHDWPWYERPIRPIRPIWHQPFNPLRGTFSWSSDSSNDLMACSVQDISKSVKSAHVNTPLKDGCTVDGSYTSQSFSTMSLDCESEATVLKIFLQGFDSSASLANSVVKQSPLRRNKFKSESDIEEITDSEDAELKALREKKLALQKEIERREIEELEKKLEQLSS